MQNIDILNKLALHVQIKVHTDIAVHGSTWYEKGSKVQYDLWVVNRGRIIIRMGGQEWTLHPGDMFFFYPDREYEAYTLDESCEFLYSHFDFVVANNKDILEAYNLDGYIPNNKVYEKERMLFQQGFREYKAKKGLYALSHSACFQALIVQVIYYQSRVKEGTGDVSSQNLIKLEPAIHHIHQKLNNNISVPQLAEICMFSEKYFITLFKKTVGMTPGQYVHHAKMERALQLLYKQEYRIKEIAYQVGYTDPYTFSKAFKKHYKVSPSRYNLEQNSEIQTRKVEHGGHQ